MLGLDPSDKPLSISCKMEVPSFPKFPATMEPADRLPEYLTSVS